MDLYSKRPSLAFDLEWLASRNERMLDENLLSVGRRSAAERVAHVLLNLLRKCRHLEFTQADKIAFPLTQKHLANALGLSLVHTNKSLKGIIGRKLFRRKGGVIELLDEARMAEAGTMDALVSLLRPLI